MIFINGLIYPISLLSVLLRAESVAINSRQQNKGQLSIGCLSYFVNLKRGLLVAIMIPCAVLHPWQAAPLLPSLIKN